LLLCMRSISAKRRWRCELEWRWKCVPENYDIKVVLSQKDKMPKAPKDYDSLSEIKEKDVDKWLEGLDKFYNIWWSWF